MIDTALSPLADALAASRGPALTIADAARILGSPPDHAPDLVHRLRRDSRFRVLDDGPALPGIGRWPAADRARYAAVLDDLVRPDRRLVLLRPAHRPPGDDAAAPDPEPGSIARLLDDTVRRLAARHQRRAGRARALAVAAYRCQAVLAEITPAPPATAPSTTPAPDPPRRGRGRPRKRP